MNASFFVGTREKNKRIILFFILFCMEINTGIKNKFKGGRVLLKILSGQLCNSLWPVEATSLCILGFQYILQL